MKYIRAVIYVLAAFTAALLLGLFLNNLINNKLDQVKTTTSTIQEIPKNTIPTTPSETLPPAPTSSNPANETTASNNAITLTTPTAVTTTEAATQVSTVQLSNSSDTFFSTIGTVKSKNTIALFAQTSATIKKVNFQEGEFVKQGDTIAELTGSNLTEHPTAKQLKIAQLTYDNAKIALANLIKTDNESLKTAQLQLQSALSQANAIPYDLQVIEQNQAGLEDGLRILQDSLNNTQQKNQLDQFKSRNDIDTLLNTLNMAQNSHASTIQQINDVQQQLDNLPPTTEIPATPPSASTPSQQAQLQQQLAKLQAAETAQSKGINDLYTTLDKSRFAYTTSLNTAQLSDNQILNQIQQSQNQNKVLDLNLQSSKTKLGFTGDTSDALQLAQQSFRTTQTQLASAIDQAQNQLKLSQLSLDLAQDQAAALQIKAPVTGLITSLNLSPGQSVSPQVAVAELIDPNQFQLEVGVDATTADQIDLTAPAQIQLAGKWLEVPIKSISPKVDAVTKQVKVTLLLPNILFKINQSFKAKLPLSTAQNQQTKAFILPLDAVTIGTESQFVFINNNGLAKRVDVKTGQIYGDQIEILSGLQPSDQVILEGAKSLTDGQTIQIK